MKTALFTSSNFTYNITLDTQLKELFFLKSINFDALESDVLIQLQPILNRQVQEANISIFARYIESILNKNNETLNSTLMEVWTQLGSDVLKLPISIHEKSIKANPVIFEKTILSAILLWHTNDLIDLCSKSPLVFQTCSSIFNELLIKLNFADEFMEYLKEFVNSICLLCEKNNIDITEMYPNKFRNILTLKAIENENVGIVSKHYIKEEFKKLASDFPKESMCLLVHFPDLYELE